MINKALKILRDGLELYLKLLPDLNVGNADRVHLTNIVKGDGTIVIPTDSLGMSLASVEEERILKSQKAFTAFSNGRVVHVNPEIKLNLYILFCANFTDYLTGTQYLSGVVRFFQSKNVFTPENTTAMAPELEKLIVEMYTLSFEQQNHLWGSLGAKYLPSVFYRVRLVAIQEAQAKDDQEPIKIIDIPAQGI